jgi:hypothetical protein
MSPDTDQIIALFKKKGYIFSQKALKLNIVGVRKDNSVSDSFDDEIHVLYREIGAGPVTHLLFKATTDPGKHWLMNPMNIRGCAIMVPGQYIDVYSIGKHQGKYEALVQTGEILFVRDSNRDSNLDFSLYRDPEKRRVGAVMARIGANIHRASEIKKSVNVGMYSAACQVIQEVENHLLLMSLAHSQVMSGGGSKFSYTLTEEQDYV